ncbi:MAG: RsmD family RNA methyltransferase [Bacteroidota bacterium]
MQEADIHEMMRPEVREHLEKVFEMTPEAYALAHHKSGFPVALVAGQLKTLQKARQKLPRMYAARCILPPRAYAQASSEAAARMKIDVKGERALDLTAGLGVDSMALAEAFKEVVAVERDPVLAEVLRFNLKLLGIGNVEVVNAAAEDYVMGLPAGSFDFIYVDPDRRDQNARRHHAITDCSPDVLALRDQLLLAAPQVRFKLSPMLDVDALETAFPERQRIAYLSVANECKEALVELGGDGSPSRAAHFQHEAVTHHFETQAPTDPIPNPPTQPSYLLDPDVALYTARIVPQYFRAQFPDLPGGLHHPSGYFLSETRPEHFPGRIYEILTTLPYKPRTLKAYLKTHHITRAKIRRRRFDIPIAKLRKTFKLAEGDEHTLLFSRQSDGQRVVYHVQKVK